MNGARRGVGEWLAALLAAYAGEASFTLAIGGPRESEAKGIYGKARVVLGEIVKTAQICSLHGAKRNASSRIIGHC